MIIFTLISVFDDSIVRFDKFLIKAVNVDESQ